jgi:hypothetical protein
LKMKAKSIDKRLFPELRDQVDEAVHNLHRFLSYKRRSKAAGTLHLAMRWLLAGIRMTRMWYLFWSSLAFCAWKEKFAAFVGVWK